MAQRRPFQTDHAALTGGPYSQAIIHDDLIYTSGQGAVDPKTDELRLGTIEEESGLALKNLSLILEEAGSSLDQVLKITLYLLDMDDYDRFNAVYRSYFPQNPPARTCVQAGRLPYGTRVEIEAIAHL